MNFFTLNGTLRPSLLLLFLCLILYLPGLYSIPPLDRDESRFAQATKQMLETKDFVRIQFQSEMRAKKPVGIYWLQAIAVSITGDLNHIWSYRLPSIFGAILSVLILFWLGRGLVGDLGAFLASLVLAPCLLLVYEAHQAKTDAMLLACVMTAQLSLGHFYKTDHKTINRSSWGLWLLFWCAQACGLLIKGPIVFMMSLLTIISLVIIEKRYKWLLHLKPLRGLILLCLIVSPWVFAISIATHGEFISQAIKGDLLSKIQGGQESHGFPPGYYFLVLWVTFWPSILFLWPTLWHGWKEKRSPIRLFCFAWIVLPWLMFELTPTKLPNYILPLYPAFALLIGQFLAQSKDLFNSFWLIPWFIIFILQGLGFYFLPHQFSDFLLISPIMKILVLGGIGLFSFALWKGLRRKSLQGLMIVFLLSSTFIFGLYFGYLIPRLDKIWITQSIASKLEKDQAVAAIGYHEPSLVFTMGTKTALINVGEAKNFLRDNPHGALIVTAEHKKELDLLDLSLVEKAIISGFNYTYGHSSLIYIVCQK
jgi:4-amino-4-deoxy-L-arabinose transferase-like glycosyltransferase